jgi:RimJ/RimL family protein N-acetyltransferase
MAWCLATKRLLLRRFTTADVHWLAALHGDPAVMRYIDDGMPVARDVVRADTLPAILGEYGQLPDGLGCFAAMDKASERPIGWFALRPPSSVGLRPETMTELAQVPDAELNQVARGAVELGYRLFPAAWGRGYATEGARALVHRAFTELRLERVVATTMTVNAASRRVLEKAGLSLVRTFFAEWPTYIEGAEHGDVEYAVTRQAWQQSSSLPG